MNNDKIEILWDSIPVEIIGDSGVESIVVKNVKTGQCRTLPVDGCFIWIGIDPNADFVGNSLKRDEFGFIVTNEKMETSIPGVFAAGDVRNTQLRQIVTSVADAAVAATSAQHYLENMGI